MNRMIIKLNDLPDFEEFGRAAEDELAILSGAELTAVQNGEAVLIWPNGRVARNDEFWAAWIAPSGGVGLHHYRFSPHKRYALFEQGGFVHVWRYDD